MSIAMLSLVTCLVAHPVGDEAVGIDQGADLFEKKIRPLFHAKCVQCHGPEKQKGALRLDTAFGLKSGGGRGATFIPGDPEKSLLIQAVRRTGDLKMPPDSALTPGEIAALVEWVKRGAVWPVYESSSSPPAPLFTAEQKAFWAFQPVADPPLPKVANSAWGANSLDHFIRATLEEHRLEPAPDVDKRTWLRRVYYDLVGLPPALDAIDAFLEDESPNAYEKVVDRLLASPHYGERWGRHWLDIVRYSDTTGQEADWVMRYAWRYRDYVINALNCDKPYDRFIIEQLAGDLLPPTGDLDTTAEQVVATGFLMLSPKATAEADKEQMVLDVVDEQIDVMGRAFLGLTVACARCHDHKFDPIPTLDYYSIAGIFRSTQTMVDIKNPTSMWSEYQLDHIPSAAEKKQLAAYSERIMELKVQLAARKRAAEAGQAEWERRLLRAAQETTTSAINEGPLTPDTLPGLHAWYRADSIIAREDGAPVRAWIDSSSNPLGLDLITEGDYEPSYQSTGFHGKPAVYFDYRSDLMSTRGGLGLTGEHRYTGVFAVNVTQAVSGQHSVSYAFRWGIVEKEFGGVLLKINGAASDFVRLELATGVGNDVHSGEVTIGQPQIWSVRYGGGPIANHTVKMNGKVQPSTPRRKAAELPLKLRDGELLFGGPSGVAMHVAEVIFFDRNLSEDEEEMVGYYLQQKYGMESEYEAPSIVRLVERPDAERTSAEQATLRNHYLMNHDSVYRDLRAELEAVRIRKVDVELPRSPLKVMAVRDEKEPKDLHVYHRGDYNQPGERAPRRFLQIIEGEDHAPIAATGSGRLTLAHWITREQHPLTARVMVNRLWQGHFGTGLVRSSDNFGVLGEKPSHPELLDWLATRFVESGWSMKTIHRLIVLSRVYRQGSVANAEAEGFDPENRLLWRMSRRRLEAEVVRDGLLAVSDSLVTTVGGNLVDWWKEAEDRFDPRRGLIALAGPAADLRAYDCGRRSVYLPVSRNQLFELFTLFDYADASSVLTRRRETTVAPQALFLMNSRHVRGPALQFAKLLLGRDTSDTDRVQVAHRRAFGRNATEIEVREALDYLAAHSEAKAQPGTDSGEARLQAWQSYAQLLFCQNEFVYID